MDWYYANGSDRVGPIDDEAFGALVAEGTIAPETLVWNSTLTDWRLWRQVQEAAASAEGTGGLYVGAAAELKCVECGKLFSPRDGVRFQDSFVCAPCKPVFFQRLKQGSRLPGVIVYAPFWPRVAAKLVDSAMMAAVSYIGLSFSSTSSEEMMKDPDKAFMFLFGAFGSGFVAMGFSFLYNTYFTARFGATPGKAMLRLRVVTPDGKNLTMARSLGRAAADLISRFTCNIGYLMVAFDRECRALHDHIAGTRVIRDEEPGA